MEEHTSTSSKGTSTTYEPVVHFKFWVNDREFESSSVFPQSINWADQYDWASEIIGKFKEGMEVDAFYDPSLPANAFLIKQYPFVYYGFFICLPMFFVLLGIHLLIHSKNTLKKPMQPVKLDDKGESVEVPFRLKIPPDKKPSSLPGEKADTRYQWRLELKISIRNRPDYRAKYPIIVCL